MGEFIVRRWLKTPGWLATIAMAFSVARMIVTSLI
jgi:hypothetical protein